MPCILSEIPFCLGYFLCGQSLFSHPMLPYTSIWKRLSPLDCSRTAAQGVKRATKLRTAVSPLGLAEAPPVSGQFFWQKNKVPKLPAASFSPTVAQAGGLAGQQPEASRQNLTATLQNTGNSHQWIHNSQLSRYGVIFQYYPTVIYNICLVLHSTNCVNLRGYSIIHIYNSTMKAIISCPVSLFI